MTNPFDIKEIVLMVALLIMGGIWGNDHYQWKKERNELMNRIDQREKQYEKHIHSFDSLQQLRDENDTTTYNYAADSLERLWTDRYQ